MRVLVTYATFAGSTAEVAETVGAVLENNDANSTPLNVSVLPAPEVDELKAYDAVVFGSAVRYGKLHPDAMAFVDKHGDALQSLPLALFVVCMTMREPSEENRQAVNEYLDPLREKLPGVNPVSVGLFAGVLDPGKLGFVARMATRMVKVPEGDHRNWEKIEDWARALRSTLLAERNN
jgi:menaquinone-dependent protoporphyrinogen oxidase